MYQLFQPAANTFSQAALRDEQGTYKESYSGFKKKLELTRKAFFTAAHTLIIQLLAFFIFTLIVLQIVSEEDIQAQDLNFYQAEAITFELAGASQQECAPLREESRSCGRCGKQTRTCNQFGFWDAYSSCEGEGICTPGTVEKISCGNGGVQERTCIQACEFLISACVEPETTPETTVEPQTTPDDTSATTESDDEKLFLTHINGQSISAASDRLYDRIVDFEANKKLVISGRAPSESAVILWLVPANMLITSVSLSTGNFTATFPQTYFQFHPSRPFTGILGKQNPTF